MTTSDKFSLRWDGYETNVSSSFRDLRKSREYFDVTLCCDNGVDTIQAHKVILASCSPLFRRILSHTNNQINPLVYLKGVGSTELQFLLDFMYNGEVSVGQESLSAFLTAAEELEVKGLASTSTSSDTKERSKSQPQFDEEIQVQVEEELPKIKRRRVASKRHQRSDPDFLEDSALHEIKSEPSQRETDIDELLSTEDVNDVDFEPFEKFEVDESSKAAKGGGGRGSSNNPETKVVLEEARFSRTKQGNALLIDKAGYCYLINRKSERKIYWKCQKKTSNNCRSNCQTEGFYITRKTAEHTHPPYPPPRNKYTEDY